MIRTEYFNLETKLPIIRYRLLSPQNDVKSKKDTPKPKFDFDKIPEWVKWTNRIGKIGEAIAYLYFLEAVGEVADISYDAETSDKFGYDISVHKNDIEEYYEVKTSISEEHSFYLTRNEMASSVKNGSNHIIFYIIIKDDSAKGIFIRGIYDLIKSFNDMSVEVKANGLTLVNDATKVFIEDIDDYIQIDLTKYLLQAREYINAVNE